MILQVNTNTIFEVHYVGSVSRQQFLEVGEKKKRKPWSKKVERDVTKIKKGKRKRLILLNLYIFFGLFKHLNDPYKATTKHYIVLRIRR